MAARIDNLPVAREAARRRGWSASLQVLHAAVLVLALAGCASPGMQEGAADFDVSLINGERAFGEPLADEMVPEIDIVALTPEMEAFVDEHVGPSRIAASRFKRLFAGLSRAGYFKSTYDADKTFNAADTFAERSGNCLSYTNMFVALAREADLPAVYQVVNVPPSWDADSGYLIRYTHVNVLLPGVKLDKLAGMEVTVDFNSVHPEPEYRRKIVSDDYATSLFYANQSVELIRSGEQRLGLAYLSRAIELAPENPDLWINLGAFYAKLGNYQAAIDAYEITLRVDPGSKGAISGLARAHGNLGNDELAAFYFEKVKRYRARNPYYHFALAQAYFESSHYADALASINHAIDLKGRQGRFYFLRGLTERKLGDLEAARKSFARAEKFGRYRDLKLRYVNELAGVSAPGY